MEYILEQVVDRSPTSCSEVAERSPISRRPIADQSPTSFSDSHAPILTKLVGDRSATSRRLIGDWSATLPGPVCDQISRSQVFVQAQKPGCDWFGRNEVPDQSPTSLQPRRDRSGTLLRPLRLAEIVSRGEVAKRLQRMSDWGLTKQGRYSGQYAGHSLAWLVVEVSIKCYYWQGSVYDIILLFKIINHSL